MGESFSASDCDWAKQNIKGGFLSTRCSPICCLVSYLANWCFALHRSRRKYERTAAGNYKKRTNGNWQKDGLFE